MARGAACRPSDLLRAIKNSVALGAEHLKGTADNKSLPEAGSSRKSKPLRRNRSRLSLRVA